MRSKSFNRKLRKPKVGFRYYRIWGNPIPQQLVAYHLSQKDSDTVVIDHPVFGWFTLYVMEAVCLQRPYSGLSSSVDNRFFRKKNAALRALQDYGSMRTSAGLAELWNFHARAGGKYYWDGDDAQSSRG